MGMQTTSARAWGTDPGLRRCAVAAALVLAAAVAGCGEGGTAGYEAPGATGSSSAPGYSAAPANPAEVLEEQAKDADAVSDAAYQRHEGAMDAIDSITP